MSRLIGMVILGSVLASALLTLIGCGTVGRVVTPTAMPASEPEPTATPTFTQASKATIEALFVEQTDAIFRQDWEAAFQACSPNYRTRRDVDRFTNDVQTYLSQRNPAEAELDVRNPEATKGRDDRFDLNYDLFLDGGYTDTIRSSGAYVLVNGTWFDDGVWCR